MILDEHFSFRSDDKSLLVSWRDLLAASSVVHRDGRGMFA